MFSQNDISEKEDLETKYPSESNDVIKGKQNKAIIRKEKFNMNPELLYGLIGLGVGFCLGWSIATVIYKSREKDVSDKKKVRTDNKRLTINESVDNLEKWLKSFEKKWEKYREKSFVDRFNIDVLLPERIEKPELSSYQEVMVHKHTREEVKEVFDKFIQKKFEAELDQNKTTHQIFDELKKFYKYRAWSVAAEKVESKVPDSRREVFEHEQKETNKLFSKAQEALNS